MGAAGWTNPSKIDYTYMVGLTMSQRVWWALGVIRWLRLDRHMWVLTVLAEGFRCNRSVLKFLGFVALFLWLMCSFLKHEFEKDNEVRRKCWWAEVREC